MKTKRVVLSLTLLAIAIGWYQFWPMLVEFRNEVSLSVMLVSWFILSSISFLFATAFLVIDKISKSRQDSLAGAFAALLAIGVKRFIIMAVFCLMACPPFLYLISGLYFYSVNIGSLNGWYLIKIIETDLIM